MSQILIVDDEPAIGWSLKERLSDEGHDVVVTADVPTAVEAARLERPDAILLDVRLGAADGLEAVPDLRVVAGRVPIVVMTAFGNLDTAVRAVQAGAFDYLVKPFDLERVVSIVRRAVAEQPAGRPFEHPGVTGLVGNAPPMPDVFRQLALVARGGTLQPGQLPAADRQPPGRQLESAAADVVAAMHDWSAAARRELAHLPEPDLHHRAVQLVEAALLRDALAHTGGNRTAAAKLLGLDRATLRTKLKNLGIDD